MMKIEELKDYGIAESVIQKIGTLGFKDLTEVQELAVKRGLFQGKNLVISAPTNTGKTFIAELAALVAATRRTGKRTFYLTPLKAIAEEKFEEFRTKYEEWGLEVAISTGERSEFDMILIEYDLIVATYEKLNSLLIKNPDLIRDLGVVVVDELQMIGDEERGVDLEILLTKLITVDKGPQIIGLSATTPNANELALWLGAELIETKTREVELREGILYYGEQPLRFSPYEIVKGDFIYREFNTGRLGVEKGLDIHEFEGLVELLKKEQAIIFVSTRKEAENLALRIASHLQASGNITEWIEKIDSSVESTPSTRNLKKCMLNGIAFHHAGLLRLEKAIVEEAFEKGDIRAICATLTLGAGVNTPAKSVIIRSTQFWDGKNIGSRDYKNMSGRAGRIRYHDDFGRSILLAETEKDLQRLWQGYIIATAERVESQLPKKSNLESSILNIVASGVCSNRDDVIKFLGNTFFGYIYYQKSHNAFKQVFQESINSQIQSLKTMGMLEETEDKILSTELGKICAEEMISPQSACIIFDSLRQNKDRIKKTKNHNDLVEPILHLATCTPDASLLYPASSDQERKELTIYWEANKDKYLYHPREKQLIFQSVRTLQMLLRWIEGVPYSGIEGFAPHGVVKSKGENMSWIIGSIRRIAEHSSLNFSHEFIEFLINLSERARHGVKGNAVEIMRLGMPFIHRRRAMLLAEAGFSSLESLIQANVDDIKQVNGIDERTAIAIKGFVDRFIPDENERKHRYFTIQAIKLGRDPSIIERLFSETGDDFARTCSEFFDSHIGIPCRFIGDLPDHEPDCLMQIDNKKIVIECKCKIGNSLVSAKEAEEILGKGAKYEPIAKVTIGRPDFAVDAKQNVKNTRITLITHTALARMLILFWQGRMSREDIINILKSGTYVNDYGV